jgi:hypothetical protein
VRKALIPVALGVALAVPAVAPAKDDYSLRLCGRSGCKLVTDPFVAAALSQETDDFGVVAPAPVAPPFYTVQYVPKGGVPIGPTYRLSLAAIARTRATSAREVGGLFERATAGIEPFSEDRGGAFRWWPLAIATFIGLAAVVAWRRLRSPRGSSARRGAFPTPVRDGRYQRHP